MQAKKSAKKFVFILFECFLHLSLSAIQALIYLGYDYFCNEIAAGRRSYYYLYLGRGIAACAALITLLGIIAAVLCFRDRHKWVAAALAAQCSIAAFSLFKYYRFLYDFVGPDLIKIKQWILTPYLLTLCVLGACAALLFIRKRINTHKTEATFPG